MADRLREGYPEDGGGGVLTDVEIRRLAAEGMISDFLEGSLQSASYDLRLGSECYTRGETLKLNEEEHPSHRLEPGQFILLTSLECLNLPDDVVGHAGLISRWAQLGLISLFSPQIDPGFVGLIVVPLFNAGNAPVTVRLGETMFTVEFVRAIGRTKKSWADSHTPQMHIPAAVEVQMARPDLTEMTKRMDALQRAVDDLKAKYQGALDESTRRDAAASASATRQQIIVAVITAVVTAAIAIAIAVLA